MKEIIENRIYELKSNLLFLRGKLKKPDFLSDVKIIKKIQETEVRLKECNRLLNLLKQ